MTTVANEREEELRRHRAELKAHVAETNLREERWSRERRLTDVKLCDDLQRIYCEEFRNEVSSILHDWFAGRDCDLDEFVRDVVEHVDSRGRALRLWLESLGVRKLKYLRSRKIHPDYYDHCVYDGYEDAERGDCATLEHVYDDDTPIPAIAFRTWVHEWLYVSPGSVCGWGRERHGSATTLRDPSTLAALLRAVTRRFLLQTRHCAYGADPNWDKLPHGRCLQRLEQLLGGDPNIHRECSNTMSYA